MEYRCPDCHKASPGSTVFQIYLLTTDETIEGFEKEIEELRKTIEEQETQLK